MNLILFLLRIFLVIGILIFGNNIYSENFDIEIHKVYDGLLKTFVNNGFVDYKGLKEKEEKLDIYLNTLSSIEISDMTKNEQLALWINAYNSFTLKLILKHYPKINSIKDIPGRWDIKDFVVAGESYSLNDIEHKILRKQFNDPRIHFAIVCASKSCPDLLTEVYFADRLEEQLNNSTKKFLSDSKKGVAVKQEQGFFGNKKYSIYLSPIFKWFKEDFEKHSNSIIFFIKTYLSEENRQFINQHKDKLSIHYMEYDWSLNGK